jgi:glutamate carboxypeptidase
MPAMRVARAFVQVAGALAALAAAAFAAETGPGPLAAEDLELRVGLAARQPEMEARLAGWVDRNTGTWNTAGLEAFAELMAEELRRLDFQVTVEPSAALEYPDRAGARTGPVVLGERKATLDPERARHFLLLGHFDTVFEPDSPFQKWRIDPGAPQRASGPGSSDMKGGLVVLFEALRALHESGDLARADWTVLLNADEEIGSLGSRARIQTAAKQAQLAFVFEPALEGGEQARSRSGAGQFHLSVEGVAAHVATSAIEGKSAVLALAKKVIAIESLSDHERGILLNVGTISGGTKRNIVPEHAEAWIDLRYDESPQGDEVRAKLERIAAAPDVTGTHAELWGLLHRPPRPPTAESDRLLALQREIARGLGYAAPEPVHSAGVTDGSLTAAEGVPTLDSLGVRGGGAHTDREFVVLASLSERAAIAAVLLRRLAREPTEGGDAPRAGLPGPRPKLESSGPSPAVIAGSRPVVGP